MFLMMTLTTISYSDDGFAYYDDDDDNSYDGDEMTADKEDLEQFVTCRPSI